MRERRRRPSGTDELLGRGPAARRPPPRRRRSRPARRSPARGRPAWRYGSAVMIAEGVQRPVEHGSAPPRGRPRRRPPATPGPRLVRAGSPTSMTVARPVATAVGSGSGSASRCRRRPASRRRSGAPERGEHQHVGRGRWVVRVSRASGPHAGSARPAGRAATAARPATKRNRREDALTGAAYHVGATVRGDQWFAWSGSRTCWARSGRPARGSG